MATTILITAEEYLKLPDTGCPTELVRGEVLTMNPPGFQHGLLCSRIDFLIRYYLEIHDIGQVVTNDTGVITRRDPDTVRGADVAYYSYETTPKGEVFKGYPPGPPQIVVEVLSPNDKKSVIATKVAEYLAVGVAVVCVADPEKQQVTVHRSDDDVRQLQGDDLWEFPEHLPGFSIPVGKIFS